MKPEDDRDPYPWIIWYIWKNRNDKLFRGIDRDSLELIRYTESECQAWHNAREAIHVPPQAHTAEETHALSLGNICMVDGSWTSTTQFSGMEWVLEGHHWEDLTYGGKKLKKALVSATLGTGSTTMGNGEYDATLDLSEI